MSEKHVAGPTAVHQKAREEVFLAPSKKGNHETCFEACTCVGFACSKMLNLGQATESAEAVQAKDKQHQNMHEKIKHATEGGEVGRWAAQPKTFAIAHKHVVSFPMLACMPGLKADWWLDSY